MFKRLGLVVVGAAALLLFLLIPCSSAMAAGANGTVHDGNGQPIPGVFVMLFDSGANVVGYAITTTAQNFTFLDPLTNDPLSDATVNAVDGFVTEQPNPTIGPGPDQLGIYQHQPRVYLKPPDTPVDIVLPTTSSFVLKGFKQNGDLMRWGDYLTMGPGANGGQFVYMTNLDEEEQPAMCWPTFDAWARQSPQNGDRQYGLPSLVVDSRDTGRYCIDVMYWYVKDYGKLCLKADNGGAGFQLPSQGGSLVIDVNYELARTAIGDLSRRQSFCQSYITDEDIPALIATVAATPNVDDRLRDALQLRDRLELKAARNSIDEVRKGTLKVTATDADGNPVKDCTVTINQTNHEFLFGANGGAASGEQLAVWQRVKDMGCELAPVLPAWGFTENPNPPYQYMGRDYVEAVFGISQLKSMGFKVKTTGSVWMQGALGILPPRTAGMSTEEIAEQNLLNQGYLLDDFKNDPVMWEAMNEPATTNTVGMSRTEMANLLDASAEQIKAANPSLNTLVNSPPEFDFGLRYQYYDLADNQTLDKYSTTYSDFLKQARTMLGSLDSIDTIGIQFYPGAHVSSEYGTGEAPAFTPSWLVDTTNRYNTLFGKPVHITELSFPSSYDADTWHSGYWRQPWDEATQADYAESVYTMMFANPDVHSVLYWDFSDDGAFVVNGGLIEDDNSTAKPSFTRIQGLIDSWTTTGEEGMTGASGQATLAGFGGDYDVTVEAPDGKVVSTTAHIDERQENELTVGGFNPVPTTSGISPEDKTAGDPGFTLTVNGTNYVAGSKVRWNGADRATTFVNDTQLTATISTSDIATAGTASVTVFNPAPGGGTSNAKTFTILKAFAPPASTTPTWYLAEGTSDYGFDTYITIENPNASAVTAMVTYMTKAGPRTRAAITLPAMSQTVVNPRNDIGATDFSTKVECKEGKSIAVDRRMTWTGPGAASSEGHSSVGVTSPAKTWYLAEGSSKWGFESWLLIQNPDSRDAWVTVTYMIEGQGPAPVSRRVPANSRASFNMETDIGRADASIKVESTVPVIPERAMYRNNRREGHDSIGTTTPAKDFYLAEGTTDWGFTTYCLVQNPNGAPNTVNITYMTPKGPVVQSPFTMEPNSRKTINVNGVPGMTNTDCSIHVQGSLPLISERAMYWGAGTALGEACHDSIGMDSPHTCFFLPDGETGNGIETWTLVQNPNSVPVKVQVSYLTPDGKGTVKFTDILMAGTRKSYNMAEKIPSRRASVMVESQTADKKIMVERAMYWNARGAGTDTIGGFDD